MVAAADPHTATAGGGFAMAFPKRRAATVIAVMLAVTQSAGAASPTGQDVRSGATPPLRADAISRIDAALAPLVAAQLISGTLLVAEAGTTVVSRSYGWSDTANRAPNRIDTRFRIGSITKQFTAMAMLLLQEQGKLRLTDPVCGHLSFCPNRWRPITLHHLLIHTSGIPDYFGRADVAPVDRATTSANLVAAIARLPVDFSAGSRWRYSNSGYVILGHIIERVTHQSYPDYLRTAILDPLRLDNTGYDDQPQAPPHAIGYKYIAVPADIVHASVAFAAGAMYSTAQDLARWTQTLIDRRFGSQASVDAMFSAQVSWCDREGTLCSPGQCDHQPHTCHSYGYGWVISNQPNRSGGSDKVIQHGGAISGFLADSRYYPDRHLHLIILTNSEILGPDSVLQRVWDAATID
jgi:CubicO group peptidase (beta-lactamase class C family)